METKHIKTTSCRFMQNHPQGESKTKASAHTASGVNDVFPRDSQRIGL
jgi:hypothetical protein